MRGNQLPLYESLWQVFLKKCFLQNIASVSSLLDGQSSLAQTAASTGILPTPPPSLPIQQSAPTTTTTPIPMDQDSVATQILNLLMAQTQQQQQVQQVQQPQPQQQTLQPQGMLQWMIFCVGWVRPSIENNFKILIWIPYFFGLTLVLTYSSSCTVAKCHICQQPKVG